MALNKQIHLYSLDTSCFYTDEEMIIHRRLSKLYSIRKKIKDKIDKIESKLEKNKLPSDLCESEERITLLCGWVRRTNKLINLNKKRLLGEFAKFKNTKGIRKLRNETLIPKNITSMFDSSTSRACNIPINTLSEDIMIVQTYYFEPAEDIILNGFLYDDEKYILLTASAGQIRTKKFVVIKESKFREVQDRLTCGLSIDDINERGGANTNKYLAYLALNNSATDLWVDFDIDKAIVVDDFETMIETEVDYVDDVSYDITRKIMQVPIPHMDGCGIMLEKTKMVRCPWMKGLMVEMPFHDLLREWHHNGDVIDIYGKNYNIFKDDIRYIFTKSQFKMWKYYDSWDDYKHNFKKFKCEASYCNIEEDNIPNAKLNYQMLQTLTDVSEEELRKLSQQSIDDINKIGNDVRTLRRLLGVDEKSNYMQQALNLYLELINDNYNRETLKAVKKKLIKEAKAGKLAINGKYTFVTPDLYAFCEWLFLDKKNPNGLLKDGEVYCNLYNADSELDCLRSPHLFREHAVRKNVLDKEKSKWFVSKGIYTSIFDPISKILMFDCDGDKLLVVQDKTLVSIAKRNMINIKPLYYEMKKANSELLTNETLYKGLDKSYRGGKIGLYSNDISKIWNAHKVNTNALKAIKLLCMENNFSIDQAKTLYMPKRPSHINELIKNFTNVKVPHFFVYAKEKSLSKVEKRNQSVVNRLDKIIPDKRISFNKTIGKFDFTMLMNNRNFEWNEEYRALTDTYDYINKTKYQYYSNSDEEIRENWDSFAFIDIKNRLVEMYGEDIDTCEMVDILIYYLYGIKKNANKFTLWASFGDIIVENLKRNTKDLGNICPVCGKRFKKNNNRQVACGSKCKRILDLEKHKRYNEKR